MLVTGEAVQAILALVVVIWLPGLGPLLVLIFLKSIAATVGDIAGRSAIPSVVDDDGLVAANAWFGGARQAADVIGPVLGGVLVAVASVRTALAVDVATFLLGIPLLLRLPALVRIAAARDRQLARGRARGLALPRRQPRPARSRSASSSSG